MVLTGTSKACFGLRARLVIILLQFVVGERVFNCLLLAIDDVFNGCQRPLVVIDR